MRLVQAEAVASGLLETLQEPTGAVTGPTRLRLLDALAKVAGLGVGTAYREVVVLLVRLYLMHVQVRREKSGKRQGCFKVEQNRSDCPCFYGALEWLP